MKGHRLGHVMAPTVTCNGALDLRYTAGQAAKVTGKSVPTITRAIAKGKLSAEKTATGGYLIDASELHRVFPALSDTPALTDSIEGNELGHETPKSDRSLRPTAAMLAEQLRILEAERERERSQFLNQVADLQARLDREGEERRALSAQLLTALPALPQPARSWRSWFKGRSSL
jgi:excisionase family DNA binding protein